MHRHRLQWAVIDQLQLLRCGQPAEMWMLRQRSPARTHLGQNGGAKIDIGHPNARWLNGHSTPTGYVFQRRRKSTYFVTYFECVYRTDSSVCGQRSYYYCVFYEYLDIYSIHMLGKSKISGHRLGTVAPVIIRWMPWIFRLGSALDHPFARQFSSNGGAGTKSSQHQES